MVETAAFRHRAVSKRVLSALFSGLMTLSICLSAFPKTARADQAANDADLIARMKNVVSTLAPTGGTSWEQYLNRRFYIATKLDAASPTLKWNTASGVPDTWKWSGAIAAGAWATGPAKPSLSTSIPYYDSASKTYYIWSGEQLLYALDKCSGAQSLNRIISIQTDIDLNGQAGSSRNWPCINELRDTFIDGNGFTIYNLRVDDSRESRTQPNTGANVYGAFIGYARGLDMRDLTFSYVNICGDYDGGFRNRYDHACGIIGFLNTFHMSGYTSNVSALTNVKVDNALIVGADQVGGLVGRTSTEPSFPSMNLSHCYAEDNVCFGRQHVSSLANSIVYIDVAEYCYSVGSVVISTGGHSGGLFSCGNGIERISDCFVDAEVYGNVQTGVFAGVMSGIIGNTGTLYSRCYSSGFVEGTDGMGGFIGELDANHMTFRDCYSTALVGLRSGATDTGGFLGRRTENGVIRNMTNCYAAGETGYTGLDTSIGATVPGTSHIGGMVGSMSSRIQGASNCYYDKQATGMREFGVGANVSVIPSASIGAGVLTEDSLEGAGLTSTAPGGAGFPGFTSGEWDYSAADHYPELRAFKYATAATWGTQERADLVKAYSLSSTSTMLLDTWDYGLNRDTGKIDVRGPMNSTTYDTVRDLTSSFTLTADQVENWDRIGEQDSKTHNESKSIIAGETYDVLSLKDTGGQYICDELVPGIEWLMVTCKVGTQEATRRVRVIPTASIEAGQSTVITELYDHADDVELFYSTGKRIELSRSDVTTGIYPDMDGQSNAITPLQNTMLNNGANTYPTASAKTANDLYYGASAGYMGKTGENAEGSALYVYIHKVTGIDPTTNEILTGDRILLTDTNLSAGAMQFNGYTKLDNTDQRYLIEYMWELKDGRVLSDAKMVRRAKMPFGVTLNLYQNALSPATLYPEGGYLYTGINAPGGSRLPLTDFSGITTVGREAATDTGGAMYEQQAQTAWKIKDPAETMLSLKLTMQNGDPAIGNAEVFSVTVDNPAVGDHLDLPCVMYRIVYRNGAFYTIPENVTRTYILQYDTANDVWHLEFDKVQAQSPENAKIYFNDVENNIFVDVVVRRGGVVPVEGGADGIPQTGDSTQPLLLTALCVAAYGGLVAVRAYRKRRGV